MSETKGVMIGVDPHKMSATIEVVDDSREQLLGTGRFPTDKAGYVAMQRYVRQWPHRTWAVEGANGAGRPLAQRLVENGEHVLDVPAKLAARVRLFDTGHNRKTDAWTRTRSRSSPCALRGCAPWPRMVSSRH